MQICKPSACSGCMACANACPKDAISMARNTLGKTIPKVNDEICVSCGLCQEVCPVNHGVTFHPSAGFKQACYAAWCTRKEDQVSCTSGGLATTFSRQIVALGGTVFGAAYDLDMHVEHIAATTQLELARLKGSKYVQSNIGDTYRQAKGALDRGQHVLFIGTPCQIAGLIGFLRKPYDNLLAVDLICHGTPPAIYLEEYLKEEHPGEMMDSLSFRNSAGFVLTALRGGVPVWRLPSYVDTYYQPFLEALTYRDNCYSCPYARQDRVSDLTIGDFWGLNKGTLQHQYHGNISVLLVNTPKGEQFLRDCGESLVLEKRDMREALAGNEQLNHPSKCRVADRSIFEREYPRSGFIKAIRATPIGRQIIRKRLVYGFKQTKCGRLLLKMKSALTHA